MMERTEVTDSQVLSSVAMGWPTQNRGGDQAWDQQVLLITCPLNILADPIHIYSIHPWG